MNPALWAALGGAAALLLALVCVGLALVVATRHRAAAAAGGLDRSRADVDALRARVEELTEELARARATTPVDSHGDPVEYVITTAGAPDPDADLPRVRDRAVLSVTVGEPLVKVAAFGYGVRRALSAESRNRIAFEMRREVRRARKARRRAARRSRPERARAVRPEEEAA